MVSYLIVVIKNTAQQLRLTIFDTGADTILYDHGWGREDHADSWRVILLCEAGERYTTALLTLPVAHIQEVVQKSRCTF